MTGETTMRNQQPLSTFFSLTIFHVHPHDKTLTLHPQSQSGKSELAAQMASRFYPMMSSHPITSIIYVGNSGAITPHYLNLLRKAATRCDVELFLFEHGLSSHEFQNDWKRSMKKHNDEIYETRNNDHNNHNPRIIGERNHDGNEDDDDEDNNDDDDDDDDDNDDDDDDLSFQDKEDSCKTFLKKMIGKQHSGSSSQRRPTPSSRGGNKKSLSKRPKIGSIKKIRNFLSLNDKEMKEKKSWALKKKPRHARAGGVVETGAGIIMTRAQKRKLLTDTNTTPSGSSQEHALQSLNTISARKKRTSEKKEMNSRSMKEATPSASLIKTKTTGSIMNSPRASRSVLINNDDEPNVLDDFQHASKADMLLTKSSSSPSETSLLRLPEKKRCPFKSGSLIIIDDHLTFNANSNENGTAKEERERYHKNLVFIQQMVLVHSHHQSLHLILISQQGLSSFGSSVNAQCLRTIR